MTTPTGRGEESQETLSEDECFDLLSNQRRRYVIQYFQQDAEKTTISNLAEQIAAWENETDVEDLSYNQRKRVYTSLQQVHLPRMDDASIVEFDGQAGTVAVGPAAETLDSYLDRKTRKTFSWSHLYCGLSLVNTIGVGMGIAGLWPGAVFSGTALAVVVTGSFLGTSLVHLYVTRREMHSNPGKKPPGVDR